MSWIDLPAVLAILGVGLLTGVGLPVVFTVGLKALSQNDTPGADAVSGSVTRWFRMLLVLACFAIVVGAVTAGLLFLTTRS
jgi:branched-subunit amino acid permease